MRRMVRAIGWVGLVVVTAIVAIVGAVYVTHPRDDAAYLAYVHRFGDYDGRHVSGPPLDQLIDAGSRACSWLGRQPPGLWRTHAPYRLSDLSDRYVGTMSDADRTLPSAVVPAAWTYLCPATTLLVKSHDVFTEPSD